MRVPENKPVLEINKNLFMLLFTLLMLRKKPTADIYLFKFNNRNTRKRCKICLMLKHFSHLFLVFLMLTWNKKMLTGKSALCWYNTETCLRHCGIFVMRFVTKIVNGWKIFFPNKSCTK